MESKFFFNESKIYDFLGFPQLIYITRSQEKYKNSNYSEIVDEEYINLSKKVEELLSPYKDQIEMFYMEELAFIELAIKWKDIFKDKTIEEYLIGALKLDESKIIQNIIHSILGTIENIQDPEEINERIKDILENKDKTLKFVKDLPIDSGEKWNLFLFIEEPRRYMEEYVALMRKLLPLFEELYGDYRKEVESCGRDLIERLEKEGAEYLSVLSNSMVTLDMIDNNEINILVSAFAPYTLRIVSNSTKPFIVWGLEIEESFKRIKQINENKLNERVNIFKNLGDKTRYEVLKLIAAKETSTKVIANKLGVTSATISYHLNNLVTAKIIKIDKSDSKYGYIIDYKLLEEVLGDFKEDLGFLQEE